MSDLGQQAGVLDVEAVAEDVQFVAFLVRGQLRAGDEVDAGDSRGQGGAGAALDRVVIRQGNRGQVMQAGLGDQFLR